jgi:hypothetical protein
MPALAAGLAALAAAVSAPYGAAEAGWRDHAYKHGAGFYIETYVDDYVTKDNRYKGSKHDKTSAKYYDKKTGKWTGEGYDGERRGKSASAKPKSTKIVRSAGSGTTSAQKSAAKTSAYAASGASAYAAGEGEVYGPPMPKELETAASAR